MSVIYAIDVPRRVVYLTTVGEPSFEEWRDTLLRVFSDPSFETGFNFISDRRHAPAPSPEFVDRAVVFVRDHKRELGRCRWAAVVPDRATDGAARTVTGRAGMAEVEVGVFYDLAAARCWVSRNV